jgi:hypothetical protein
VPVRRHLTQPSYGCPNAAGALVRPT